MAHIRRTIRRTLAIAAGLNLLWMPPALGQNAARQDTGPQPAPTALSPQAALPSWNEGATKQAIVDFVRKAADPGSGAFIPEADRIAVFDNDGTLWAEQPLYFQAYFILDRARQLAAADPAWASTPTRKAAASGDLKGVMAGGEAGLVDLASATSSGMSMESYIATVRDWLKTARHPTTGRRIADMTYAPMVELLDYLRANNFKIYIASGGGVDFIRAFSQEAYGIPPENVIGSMGKARFGLIGGKPEVIKDPGVEFVDDKEGKPVGIARHIGKRPVFIGGNSDGDLEMGQWATSGAGPRLVVIVHHTDGKREWAYDRQSAMGKLDKALSMQGKPGWLFIDMARDWKRIWRD